jgi:DNA polymerase III epsilon subunit-like protein
MTLESSEVYISVDIETAGPSPGRYSLLSIGACTVEDHPSTFYVELKPLNREATPQALTISGLSLERLEQAGLDPGQAMARFAEWLESETPPGVNPVFVAFNAPFDWMFVNEYFHRYLGRNPFGHSALDVKSFYMGLFGVSWAETAMKYVGPRYQRDQPLTHHALSDALDQAAIFQQMLLQARDQGRSSS